MLNCLFDSVDALESQIAELERETESLSRSLESQKTRTSEVEAAGQRKADDLNKEVQKRVGFLISTSSTNAYLQQSSEIDQLKAKLRTLSDYDEIKRELEIMKVCLPSYIHYLATDSLPVCGILRF